MTDHEKGPPSESLRDEAAVWLMRIQSDAATERDWAELRLWLEGSPARQTAFEEAERLWSELDDLASELASALEPATAEVVPFKPRKRAWVQAAVAAAAAIAAAVLVTPLAWQAFLGPEQIYRTSVGETRAITLADGSHVQMDAASTLRVRLGWTGRRLDLPAGEASFDVMHEPRRPFTVRVGAQEVRVLGTRFNIDHYDGDLVVTVARGLVEVRQAGRGGASLARLPPGAELRLRGGAGRATLTQVDAAGAFAWAEGRLVCDDKPVAEIVAYLNRRYATNVSVTPEVAQRRFTGVLQLEGEDLVLQRLSGYLGVPLGRQEGRYSLG
jgi:transmembrane sensor